jgi:ribosomal-protein-serine acetyltransferase
LIAFELTHNTSMRPLDERDADELYALIEVNRAHLARWMPWAERQTSADTLAFIRSTRRQLAAEAGMQLAIVEGGQIVGVAGFHTIDRIRRSSSIGYWLGEQAQGKGIMSAAVSTLIEHGFSVWKLARIEIRAAVGNARSRALIERLGLREEGVLTKAERVGDKLLDQAVYAITPDEWDAAQRERVQAGHTPLSAS